MLVSEYPEHEKLKLISDKSQSIGDFLAWCGEQGIALQEFIDKEKCLYVDERGECVDGTFFPVDPDEEARDCKKCRGSGVVKLAPQYVSPRESTVALLARFFQIDQDRIETEKRAMLDKLREINNG